MVFLQSRVYYALLDLRRICYLVVYNSGKQGKVVHTLRFFTFSPARKPVKSAGCEKLYASHV